MRNTTTPNAFLPYLHYFSFLPSHFMGQKSRRTASSHFQCNTGLGILPSASFHWCNQFLKNFIIVMKGQLEKTILTFIWIPWKTVYPFDWLLARTVILTAGDVMSYSALNVPALNLQWLILGRRWCHQHSVFSLLWLRDSGLARPEQWLSVSPVRRCCLTFLIAPVILLWTLSRLSG